MRYALVTAVFILGCSSPVNEGLAPDDDDLAEPAAEHNLPDDFDDGLGKLLDEDPINAEPVDPKPPTTTATPMCDATAKSGDYCGGDKVTDGNKSTLYHCTGPSTKATVVRVCASGCAIAPPGSDDYCKTATSECPHNPTVLKYGLHPVASDRLRCAGITAARITQTIGNAVASAGTHAQDGTVDGKPYCAATDLSVSGLTDTQVKTLIAKLDTLGFAAFFRKPGYDGWPSSEARHIHAVFAGAKMKSSLRSQITDFLAGKNGLASHTTYTFYQPPPDVKAYIKMIFLAANS
jgi:hypothetical protein